VSGTDVGNREAVRRFTVFDAMVLIAATAVGLAVARPLAGDYVRIQRLNWAASNAGTAGTAGPSDDLGGAAIVAMCLALSWTLALLPLRLRRPRPDRAGLFRQPGFAAGVSVLLASAILSLYFVATVLRQLSFGHHFRDLDLYAMVYWPTCGMIYEDGLMFGPSVCAAWLILAGSGGWRSEPSWIDRAGRALGGFWVLSTIGLRLLWFL
jgi:hypothetical protein